MKYETKIWQKPNWNGFFISVNIFITTAGNYDFSWFFQHGVYMLCIMNHRRIYVYDYITFAFKWGWSNFLTFAMAEKYIWLGGNVIHAVVKITNYTTNYDGVDIRRGVVRRFALKVFYALYMRINAGKMKYISYIRRKT